MKPIEAVAIIAKLKQLTTKYCSLTPEDWAGTGLKPKHVLRKETGEIMFYYVDRVELIELLARSHNLYPKSASCPILNN